LPGPIGDTNSVHSVIASTNVFQNSSNSEKP
jgi:hypothetical protein